MSDTIINTTIDILGKSYPVRCHTEEKASLEEAARLLDQKMTEIKESGKAINFERIAIISALNIAHQFIKLNQEQQTFLDRLTGLKSEVETALALVPEV